MSNAAKELNDLYGMLQHVKEMRRYDPELEMEFKEKLVAERDKHPRGELRKWIEANCEFTYGQARHCITTYEQETNTAIIRAENDGRQSLVWEKIKDRVEPHLQRILAIINTVDPDERTDAECAVMNFIDESFSRTPPIDDSEGHNE